MRPPTVAAAWALCLQTTVHAAVVINSPFRLVDLKISTTSAANLPNGNVLLWIGAGSGTTQQVERSRKTNYQIIRTDGTDINGGAAKQIELGEMFCTGTTNLPWGNLLINGGSNTASSIVFLFGSSTFFSTTSMTRPRGYNANCLTTDNRVFTLGGEWGPGGSPSIDYYGEIMTLGINTWSPLPNVRGSVAGAVSPPNQIQSNQNHMWLFAFKDAGNKHRVFKAGPTPNMHVIDLAAGSMRFAGTRGNDAMGMQGTAVQYAPGKILTLSGAVLQDNPDMSTFLQASKAAFIVDIAPLVNNPNANPTVTGPITRSFARVFHNAVILPNGEVLVVGGQTNMKKYYDEYGVLQPELFNPTTNTFRALNDTLQYARNYHSIALLLQDGRVLIAGGGSNLQGAYPSCDIPTSGCYTHFNAEIYTPPYLQGISESARPNIVSAVNNVVSGCSSNDLDLTKSNCRVFAVTISANSCGAGDANRCKYELIRLSSVTHSVNNDQLRIPLVVNSLKSTNVALVSIPSGSIPFTVSGYYFLFAINKANNVPSVATTIRVNRF